MKLNTNYQISSDNPITQIFKTIFYKKVLNFLRLESARDGYIREFKLRKDHMQRSEYDLPYYKIFPKYLAAVPPGFIIGNVALL